MMIIRLAWRNLRRNKRRTWLTCSALCIGLTMLIVVTGIMDGTDSQSVENLVKYDLAHVKGFAPHYLDEEIPGLDHILAATDSLVEVISMQSEVKAVTARINMAGVLIAGGEETFVQVVGVDLESDRGVFETLDAVVDGQTLSRDIDGALIGDKLAGDMNLKTGDQITLMVRSAPGAFNTRQAVIAGIVSTGHPAIDGVNVMIPLKSAQAVALMPDGATEIDVLLKSRDNSAEVSALLQERMPSIDWRGWSWLARDFLGFTRLKRTGSGVITLIFVVMAAVGVANTMVIAIHERTREIGTLRAMGFTSKSINILFMAEGVLIGLIGGLSALVLGGAIVQYLSVHGISLAAYQDMDIGYPIRDAIYPVLTMKALVATIIFGLFVTALASWGSARRAARGEVVRALREGML